MCQVAVLIAGLTVGIDVEKYVASMEMKVAHLVGFAVELEKSLKDASCVMSSALDSQKDDVVLEVGRVARASCYYHVCAFSAYTFF